MVKATPQTTGDRWDITVGGGRNWTLEPQVHIAGCKPDFVLRCSDPSVPPMAIFCDGERYHASPQHNRLADDAAKRRILREVGDVRPVVRVGRPRRRRPLRPTWFDATAARPS